MGNDIEQDVGVALDAKIEAPIAGHAGLPAVASFIVLPGVQRRVSEVLQQQQRLLIKRFLNPLGRSTVSTYEMRRGLQLHLAECLGFLTTNFLAASWRSARNSLWF